MRYQVGTPKNCNPLKRILLSLIVFFVMPQVSYAQTATLDLTWNQNSEGDLKGYKVYYRAPAGAYGDPKDVGNITKYTLLGLESQKNYFVAITAYDTSGNESNKSEEISGVAQLSPNTSTTTPITTSTPGPVTTTSTPGPVTTTPAHQILLPPLRQALLPPQPSEMTRTSVALPSLTTVIKLPRQKTSR
jgi:hypothetical protein